MREQAFLIAVYGRLDLDEIPDDIVWLRMQHLLPSHSTLALLDKCIIGSDNGLAPTRRQAIIWTNVSQIWTNRSQILQPLSI